MNKYRLMRSVAGVFIGAVLFLGPISFAQAELISNQQVEEQKKEVLLAVVGTLQEHVKLLQMVLIQRLEAQVKHLQTLADNQQ